MPKATITEKEFFEDRQGRTFADVIDDADQPFHEVIKFFNDEDRQLRMEESEIHHDRPALAGVVRELESQPRINQFLSSAHNNRNKRLRQAIGVLIRMIMEQRGWKKTGKKGSLGVRATASPRTPNHNTGGLALWFIRAERYERNQGMPFRSTRERCQDIESAVDQKPSNGRGQTRRRRQGGASSTLNSAGKQRLRLLREHNND